MDDKILHIAEVPYADGTLHFRYARRMSADGSKWIKHGLFQAFHPNGMLSAEGLYEDDLETGLWRLYHENGQMAAEGEFRRGKETGVWRFWDDAGVEESSEDFGD